MNESHIDVGQSCEWFHELEDETCVPSLTRIYWSVAGVVVLVVSLAFIVMLRKRRSKHKWKRFDRKPNETKNEKRFYDMDLQSLSHSLQFSESIASRL